MIDALPEKTITVPIPPVSITTIGETALPPTVVQTPAGHPNLVVTVVTPLVAILVRFGNTFCVSLAGTLAAGGLTTTLMPHTNLVGLIQSAAIIAASIAGVGLVKDCATVFSGLEKTFPLASGSV